MKGYRTIITNVLMAIASILAIQGVEIPVDMVNNITTGIISAFAVINLILRKMTTTPMGEKE